MLESYYIVGKKELLGDTVADWLLLCQIIVCPLSMKLEFWLLVSCLLSSWINCLCFEIIRFYKVMLEIPLSRSYALLVGARWSDGFCLNRSPRPERRTSRANPRSLPPPTQWMGKCVVKVLGLRLAFWLQWVCCWVNWFNHIILERGKNLLRCANRANIPLHPVIMAPSLRVLPRYPVLRRAFLRDPKVLNSIVHSQMLPKCCLKRNLNWTECCCLKRIGFAIFNLRCGLQNQKSIVGWL